MAYINQAPMRIGTEDSWALTELAKAGGRGGGAAGVLVETGPLQAVANYACAIADQLYMPSTGKGISPGLHGFARKRGRFSHCALLETKGDRLVKARCVWSAVCRLESRQSSKPQLHRSAVSDPE